MTLHDVGFEEDSLGSWNCYGPEDRHVLHMVAQAKGLEWRLCWWNPALQLERFETESELCVRAVALKLMGVLR